MSKRSGLLIFAAIIVIAVGMRLYGLDRQSLWYDEIAEESAFQRQFLGDRTIKVPDTPPLHSFFIYPVKRIFPDNDFALRMVPFTFGLISVPLMFLLGRRLFDEKVGLIASFLLAISPFHIWYSQDARMYALQWMLALISLIYFLRALEQPGKWNFIGYVISTVAGLYTLQLTVFLVGLQMLYIVLFLQRYRTQFLRWTGAFGAIIILYSPWIIYQLTSLMDRGLSSPKDTGVLIFIPYTFYTYFAGFSIGPSLRELHISLSLDIFKPYIHVVGSLMAVYGAMFVLGLWSLRNDRSRLLFLLLLSIVPIIGLIILMYTVVPKMSYNVRYTGIALFGFLLFIAKGVDWLSDPKFKMLGRILAIFAIIAMTGFSAYSYANYQFDKRYHKEDIRGAVAYVKEKIKEDDVILVITSTSSLIFNRYAKKDFYSIGYPPIDINDKERIEKELKKMTEGKERMCLILSQEWTEKALVNYTKAWLDTNYFEIKELHKGITEIGNLRIYCYDLAKRNTANDLMDTKRS